MLLFFFSFNNTLVYSLFQYIIEDGILLAYTYFIATNYSNGVGSQVFATLVTTLPLIIKLDYIYIKLVWPQ